MGVLAFVVYGSWAIFANWEYGIKKSLIAGLTQGLMSFLITTFMTFLMIWLLNRGSSRWMSFLYAVICTNTVTITSLVVAHLIAGTPEILLTIMPSMIIGFVYIVSYSLAYLHQEAKYSKSDCA